MEVSQNRAGCVEVSWKHPSGGPTVISYTIYFQKDGEERKSVEVESAATTAVIPDLITGSTYSFTMVAISGTQIPSTESAAVPATIIKGAFMEIGVRIKKCLDTKSSLYIGGVGVLMRRKNLYIL